MTNKGRWLESVFSVDVLYALLLCWRWLSAVLPPDSADPAAVARLWADGALYVVLRCLFYMLSRVPLRSNTFLSRESLSEVLVVAAIALVGSHESWVSMRQIMGQAVSNHSLYLFTGSLKNPGPLGGLLAVTAAVLLSWLLRRWSNRPVSHPSSPGQWLFAAFSLWVLAALFACIVLLPATLSRAAWTAFAFAAAVVLLPPLRERLRGSDMRQRFSGKRKWLSLLATAALVVVLAIGGWQLKPRSAAGRLYIDRISLRIIADNLWTGVGPGNYAGAYGRAQEAFFARRLPSWDTESDAFLSGLQDVSETNLAGCPEYAFNEYLQTGVESGLPALLMMLCLTVIAAYRLCCRSSPAGAGLVALCIFSLFSYPFALPVFRGMLTLFLAMSAGCSLRPCRSAKIRSFVSMALILVCVWWLAGNFLPREKQREATLDQWRNLRVWYSGGDYELVVEHYPALLREQPRHTGILFEYGRSLHLTGDHRRALEVLEQGIRCSSDPMFLNVQGNCYRSLAVAVPDSAQHYTALAEESYRRAFCRVPGRLYPLSLLLRLYREQGLAGQAARMAAIVAGYEPRIDSPAVRELKREAEIYILEP